MPPLLITDLGLLSWSDAYALQQRIVVARKAGVIEDVLLFCQHPHVLTLGRNASQKNLLASEHVLRQKNVELRETNRGGDITYHGPGQIVGYPILDLDRIPGKTGIWVQPPGNILEEKLAAIGVHISRWVTSHGFAFNVSTDLRYFDLIIPCGIADRKATSLEKLLHRNVSLGEVKPRLTHHLAELFSLTPREVTPSQLLEKLDAVGPAF
jgi:lipoyl(octanoyl) transferase